MKSSADFQSKVLQWVSKMQNGPVQFKMSAGSGSSIFTSCFALFIFDLFNEVAKWPAERKNTWSEHINSFQDKASGYFLPAGYVGELGAKAIQQLTCFCLSALAILDSFPRYTLDFAKQWSRPDDVCDYLEKTGCFEGKPTTGNMAMFLAVFLTHQYERTGNPSYLACIEAWFRQHEEKQNKTTGFWGAFPANKYYPGFQNAFHQYTIFNYWDRTIPAHKKIVDAVLMLQDAEGHFAPMPGGNGCWDYDAADILINCGYKKSYKIKEIKDALTRLYFAILNDQNQDGGFCESKKKPGSIMSVLSPGNLKFIFTGLDPYLWYYRSRWMLGLARKKREKIIDHWVEKGRAWDQSDLWNTWFRCLTLAEIIKTLDFDTPLSKIEWKFHNTIGLGYFALPGKS